MIEMKVSGIVLDPSTRSPIVILRDVEERRALMIWIGAPEANAIMHALEKVKLARPATHDLFTNTLDHLKIKLDSVAITRMEESTFYAALNMSTKNPKGVEKMEIDARPSDAIALSLRANAPIFVSEEVMISSSVPINPAQEEKDSQEFKDFINQVRPSDFIRQAKGDSSS